MISRAAWKTAGFAANTDLCIKCVISGWYFVIFFRVRWNKDAGRIARFEPNAWLMSLRWSWWDVFTGHGYYYRICGFGSGCGCCAVKPVQECIFCEIISLRLSWPIIFSSPRLQPPTIKRPFLSGSSVRFLGLLLQIFNHTIYSFQSNTRVRGSLMTSLLISSAAEYEWHKRKGIEWWHKPEMYRWVDCKNVCFWEGVHRWLKLVIKTSLSQYVYACVCVRVCVCV